MWAETLEGRMFLIFNLTYLVNYGPIKTNREHLISI